MLLSSFVLLAIGRGKAQLEGAVKYVVLNIVASMIFLIGAGLVYATLGTLNFADIAHRLAEGQGSTAGIRVAAVFLLIAFSVKAGLFPLYAWLPSSYHTPSHTVSAVFAGLLTKVGVYALIRTFGAAFAVEDGFVLPVLGVVSLATMVVGVLGAASQFHVRKILSFHIISQIGYMTFGLALGTAGAIAAAIFYVIHHILVKTNLFFAASVIDRIGGGEDLKKTGGLYGKAPWLAALFLIPALSLGGIPPFSGFWAKLALLREILGVDAWVAAAIALIVGIFTLFSMTKIWAEAFWKDRPANAAAPRRIYAGHVVPMVLLAAGTVALSIYPTYLFELAEIAANDLLNPPVR
jgi:multicomponent Na+:H+ antiporter subunit D